jgi:predicted nucleic acid-binding Zn ribbon protein
MALYNYKCQNCEKVITDVMQSIHDEKFTTASEIGGCDCEDKNGPVKRLMSQLNAQKNMSSDLRGRGYQVTQGKAGRRY